ncbi:MAG: response regulator [Ignavibacteriaceae bacterium]|nr:response regulator [Ignavibacteriaceae bacterium]
MAKYFQIVCLITLLNSVLYTQTEKMQFEQLTREDGLSEGSAWCILQDSKGFLWIGTADGLNRYDGYQFKIFRNIHSDLNSISNSQVLSILEDKTGTLWIGTDGGGLNKFNSDKETFTRYIHNPNDSTSISDNAVWSIYEDNSENLWIGTFGGGLNKFDRSKEPFIRYSHNPDDTSSLSFNTVVSVYEDSKRNLWIATLGGGLNILTHSERKKTNPDFIHFRHDPNDSKSLSSDQVSRVYEDRNGVIWVGTLGEGLNQLVWEDEDKLKATFIHYKNHPNESLSISGNEIVQIYEDRDGEVWIGTWGGGLNKLILGIDKNSLLSFKSYTHNASDPSSLSNNIVYTIYEDNSGLLWVGSWGAGFNKFNKKKKAFKHYKNIPNDPSSLSVNGTYGIIEDRNGYLWIGTWDGGLDRLDRKTNKFKHYRHNPDDPSSISDNEIYSVYEDKSGMLWIGTFNGGLNLLNPETEKFTHYQHNPADPTSISSNFVNTICEDKDGRIWLGTFGAGLNRFDRKTGEFVHYRYSPDDINSLSGDNPELLYVDKFGELWVGTHSGLNKYNKENDNFIRYRYDLQNPASLSNDYVLCICEDKVGGFWIGTNGGGLNKYNRETGKFFSYRISDGLPNDVIYGILEDDHGNLWLSTNDGLCKFNPVLETFRNYDVSDGLQGKGFNAYSYCKSKTGEMIFGGPNGINIFHPESIKDNEHIPPIYVTNFLIYNKPVSTGFDSTLNRTILKKSIIEAEEIVLTHDDKVISVEFAALDFHVPEKNKYAYILEGFEKDWNYTDSDRRFATYTNLDPGEYIFRVKGSNNDGIWNEAGTSIKIIILPPWWSTTWAYVFYVLIIISIIYFTWKLQLRRIRIKHELEIEKFEAEKMHEVDEIKNRFFANISHEFRTPLTLIFGPAKDIMDETKESKTKQRAGVIRRNADRLYGLVNQLLDISKLEAGKMKLETSEQNIIPLLKEQLLSFSSFAERKKITLQFISPMENLNVYVDKDKLEKIISNLLSNALKFTPDDGEVSVSVESSSFPPLLKGELKGGFVRISVSDNGIGIPKERIDKIFDRFYQVDSSHTRENEGAGIGLALTKELVELHKGKIEIESKEGKGTTFTLTLPLGKVHLRPEEICKPDKEEKAIFLGKEVILEPESKKDADEIETFIETSKPSLLIVEDNSDVREYVIDHLEGEYRILEAVDGEEGLNEALTHIPDLIISDIMMPKMDGFEMCKRIKEDERTSHIPLIMLTAKATDKDKISGYKTGADDYIMKPFDTKVLQARIKNLIEIRRKLHDKFSADDFVIPNDLNPVDKQFMKKVIIIINEHISEEEFSIEELSKEVAMSNRHLQRKLIALTGRAPKLFVRSIKLRRAKKLIKENKGTISEIAYDLGFRSPAYFSKCFKEEFGCSPSELATK